ncbi:hypothetical protein D910_11856 [Dendroctonus ponderosae]|uniref:Uncharacterized protein n=1 Tax=Dendroctonus ponderosae TaxID=77166 RepID=U4UKH3_DENPD|nr:hypothetical protein D910_11856 [Dendroctonus ponderosae]
MKELVYAREVHTREELIQRITDAAITLRQTFSGQGNSDRNKKAAHACVRRKGLHFEQDLK